jgi:glycosyltransferase involved in cell wall biosynthesis
MIARMLVVDVQGPRDPSYSLGIVNRHLARALAQQPGVRVCADGAACDATHVVRNTYPPVFDDLDPARRSYAYFAWEDSLIPADWAMAFNRHLDGVMVPSAHVRDVLARSGVAVAVGVVPAGVGVTVGVVPHGVEPEPDAVRDDSPLALPTRKRFRFLHVSTGFPRKGCDVLLRAFAREFSWRDDVCLILKTLPQYDHPTARRVRWTRLRHPWGPEILHIDRDLDAVSMRRLYRAASCLVHPARAEGFGLPVAEAMLAEIPVIVTRYSGPADFCSDDTAMLVGYRLTRSRSPFVVKDAEWAEPDEGELRRAMRAMYERPAAADVRRKVANAAAHVRACFTWERAAARAVAFVRAVDASAVQRVRAGMVTTWNQRCGIAEYSRQLIDAMPGETVRWSILAPEHVPTIRPDSPDVVRCWRDQWPLDLTRVAAEAARRDLRLLHFQTHFTMWGAEEGAVLSRLRRDGRHVFMTLHSVRGARPGAAAIRALRTIDRIFVHTADDRDRLAALGLDDNVTTLPQGFPAAPAIGRDESRRTLGIAGAPVIGTFGFLRPHKGLAELVEAIAILRRRHPNVVMVARTALYPSDDSVAYHRQCVAAVERLGLRDHCRILTDFVAPEECVAMLRACDVVALPYRPTIDSAGAAVRTALASRTPVLTTASPAFHDVEDLVFRIDRTTPRAIARGLSALLDDRARADAMVARAEQRVAGDAWEVVGRTYAKFVTAAVADLTAFAQPYPIAAGSRD